MLTSEDVVRPAGRSIGAAVGGRGPIPDGGPVFAPYGRFG